MVLVQILIIALSSWVIIGSDSIWESLWPDPFWKCQVAELEKCAKKDLWHLKSVEWELMKGRIALSVAVSSAKDKAECLGTECEPYMAKAKEEAVLKLRQWKAQELRARAMYQSTLERLKKAKLMSDQQGHQGLRDAIVE